MSEGRIPTHHQVVNAIVRDLEPLGYVHAVWEGGAVAFGRADEWSDIDLYIVVDDDKIEESFQVVERALERISPIKQKFDIGQTPQEGVYQAFYRLRNASEYLLIDLAVLKLSAPDMFLEPEIHGSVVFHFNRDGSILPKLTDRSALADRLRKRLNRLKERRDLFTIFVQKEINRGNFLEAFDAYRVIVYEFLLELLRMKHYAFHHNFKLRYVYHELPADVIRELERLIQIDDMADLETKFESASKWAERVLSELDNMDFDELLDDQI